MVLDTIGHMKFSLSWVTEVHDRDFEAEVQWRYWTEVWSWFCSWKIVNLRELKFSPDFAAKVWWKFRSWSLINNLNWNLANRLKLKLSFQMSYHFGFRIHCLGLLCIRQCFIRRWTSTEYKYHVRRTGTDSIVEKQYFVVFSPVNSMILNVSSEFLCASLVCLSPKNRLRDKGEPKCVW